MKETIGTRIKRIRKRHGLTLAKFGECIGLGAAAVNAWERGIAEPRPAKIDAIASIFHVSKDWLIFGTGDAAALPPDPAPAEVSSPKPPETSPAGRLDIDVVTRIFNALTDEEQSVVIDAITTILEKKAAAAREKLDRLTDGQG